MKVTILYKLDDNDETKIEEYTITDPEGFALAAGTFNHFLIIVPGNTILKTDAGWKTEGETFDSLVDALKSVS